MGSLFKIFKANSESGLLLIERSCSWVCFISDVAIGMQGYNPIDNYQLTKEEIKSCEEDPKKKLKLIVSTALDNLNPRIKDTKYNASEAG